MSIEKLVMHECSTPDIDWTYEYERLAPQLARYAFRVLGDADEAADVVHDSFIAAMRARSSLRDAGAFVPWLYRIVSNRALSHLRRRRLLRLVGLREQSADITEQTETQILVRAALRELPPEQALALVLAHHEGFARAEIASITGVPIETVKTRLARGRKKFAAVYLKLEGRET